MRLVDTNKKVNAAETVRKVMRRHPRKSWAAMVLTIIVGACASRLEFGGDKGGVVEGWWRWNVSVEPLPDAHRVGPQTKPSHVGPATR